MGLVKSGSYLPKFSTLKGGESLHYILMVVQREAGGGKTSPEIREREASDRGTRNLREEKRNDVSSPSMFAGGKKKNKRLCPTSWKMFQDKGLLLLTPNRIEKGGGLPSSGAKKLLVIKLSL